jgi:SRSO17 transposase
VILLVEGGAGTGAATGDHRCVKTEDQTVAVGHSIDLARWQDMFEILMGRIAGRFSRVEPRRRARGLVLGLLSDLPRKNCWTLAEHAGDATPDGLQHLLSRARWDADAVRDDIRLFVVEQLGHVDAVLVVDETGDLKKGTATVGVQRQYTGTAGRIENSQVAVYLAYSTPRGHAAIDRELYMPRSWTDDPARCRAAGIPDTVGFATKPALAARMVARALDAGVSAPWVAGDEVYGGNPHLRTALEERQVGYVLAVACDHQITTRAGKLRADALVEKLPNRAWQKLSAGAGAKGHRFYDWALADIIDSRPGHRHLLVRRNRRTGELAFYRCYSAAGVSLSTLVKVAGRRWTVEEIFQSGKSLAGLDEHQVRRWTSWHRWVTLAMLAHAFLAAATADQRAQRQTLDGLIPLTCNEIQHLFTALATQRIHPVMHTLRWSTWRRRHQARARTGHYRRQPHTTAPPAHQRNAASLGNLTAMTRSFPEAMRLMRSRDPQRQEDGFHQLLPHAAEHLDELIEQFEHEQDDHGLRCWLLELIAAAASPAALPTFAAQLNGPDEALRDWAAVGLSKLNTPEARTLLRQARVNGTIT